MIEPEGFGEGNFSLFGEVAPAVAFFGGSDAGELAEQANPEDLNLDGIPFARCAGRVIGIHPGEMARAPDEAGDIVHADAVRRAGLVVGSDISENVGDGAA